MHRNLIAFIYKYLLKPIFFAQDPENVHDRMLEKGRVLGKSKIGRSLLKVVFDYQHPSLNTEVTGIRFVNPVGLSAGFDKDANLFDTLDTVGFGYMQIGSVTREPYEGNPKPRLYRLPKSSALVVYYGLKNLGVEIISNKLKGFKNPRFPISISVAKTNSCDVVSPEQGAQDYIESLEILSKKDVGDFYTINISCPNTFGGEPFTDPDKLKKLLSGIQKLNINKPIFLKMPLNESWETFNSLLEVAIKHDVSGVIIANLHKDRDTLEVVDEIPDHVKGGIGGKPTVELCNELISKTYAVYADKLVIVGVGGVFSAEDAYEKIKRGASLIQLITGMVYNGPQLIGQINKGLVKLLKADGYSNISDAVGAYHRD